MAIAIKPLRKFTSGTPTSADMEVGEIAVNTADQKIWMRNDSGAGSNADIIEIGNVSAGGGGASVSISETAPGSPSAGDLWWDSTDDDANLKIYYTDGNSTSQWVTATVAGGQVAGSNTQIQYNNSDKFGASGNLTFNGSTLAVAGNITASSGIDKVTLIATNTTDSTHYPVFVDTATGNEEPRTDSGFTYNPNSGTLTSTIFVGNLTGAVTGNADTATTATNVTASANNSTDETVYPTFVDGVSGAQGIETDSGLTYNPSSGILTSTQFTGALSGNASTATEATNVTAAADGGTNATYYPAILDGATGTQGVETHSGLTYNPSTGLFSSAVLVATTNIRCGDGGTIGSATTNDAMTVASDGIVTFKDDIKIKDAGTIGNASVADVMTLTAAGETQFKDDVELVTDGKDLKFGANSEIRLRHVHDTGLELRQSSTNDTGFTLTFNALDTAITAGNVLGKIEFKAGAESGGTDAILPGAFISAVAEGTFAADSNATKLSFGTASSETAAEKMSLSSAGLLTLSGNLKIPDSGTIGTATTPALIVLYEDNVRIQNASTDDGNAMLQLYSTVADSASAPDMYFWRNSASPADGDYLGKISYYGENDAGEAIRYVTESTQAADVTDGTEDGLKIFSVLSNGSFVNYVMDYQGLKVPDGFNIGSISDIDAMSIGADGDVTLTQDLELHHDGAILSFGANDEIALTHVHDTGLLLTDSGGTPTLQLHDSNESVSSDGSNLILTSGGTAFKLPTADGSADHVLKTDGGGNLSFVAQSGGGGGGITTGKAIAMAMVFG